MIAVLLKPDALVTTTLLNVALDYYSMAAVVTLKSRFYDTATSSTNAKDTTHLLQALVDQLGKEYSARTRASYGLSLATSSRPKLTCAALVPMSDEGCWFTVHTTGENAALVTLQPDLSLAESLRKQSLVETVTNPGTRWRVHTCDADDTEFDKGFDSLVEAATFLAMVKTATCLADLRRLYEVA